MKCPKCGEEMEKGNVTVPSNLTWYPGERQVGFVKNQVWLGSRWNLLKTMFGPPAEGYICKKDKWISFQYPG